MKIPFDAINLGGFAARDLQGQDEWQRRDETAIPFGTQFSLTLVGTGSYDLRWRRVGKSCQFQSSFSSTTSIATTAGTSYMVLPVLSYKATGDPAGLSGIVVMVNMTTNVAVGNGVIDVTNSRAYLPTQAASGNTFAVWGEYEVA